MSQEMIEKLKAELSEEIKGVHEYIKLADEVEEYYSCKMLEIAMDEYTHAKCLCDMLKDEGVPMDEMMESWKEMCRVMDETFH